MKFHLAVSLAVLGIILASVAACAFTPPDEEDVRVFVLGPSVVGTNQTVEYRVIVTGGPAENGGKWTFSSTVLGFNLTHDSLSPENKEAHESGHFSANLTAPQEPQTLRIRVSGRSENMGIIKTGEATKEVKVIRPYVLTATVKNNGSASAEKLNVRFYVDGDLIETKVVNRIGVGDTIAVSANWTMDNPQPGRHVVRVELDTQDQGIVLAESGSAVYMQEFFIKEKPKNYPWTISILALVAALIASIYLLRKSGYL